MIDEIKYKNEHSKGTYCADGTRVSLDYQIQKKNHIEISCFRYTNKRYEDISKLIKYIDSLTDQINFDFE